MYMYFIFCASSRPDKTARQIRRPRKKKTQYTVNIGLNFEGEDKDIAKTHTGNYKLPELYILWFHINIR